MSATPFSLLFANGLREHHSVLDFDCGSRSVLEGFSSRIYRSKSISRNRSEPCRLIDDRIANELGQDAIKLKRPSFAYNDTFDCSAFGAKFDFIMAQSVATHCGPDLLARMLASFHDTLQQDGLIFTIGNPRHDRGHVTAGRLALSARCVVYTDAQLHEFFGNATAAMEFRYLGIDLRTAWYAVAVTHTNGCLPNASVAS